MKPKNSRDLTTWKSQVLDPISPSFCGAKWLNATVWLGNGMTASCHHPPGHLIPLDELARSPKALHNTQFKKSVRKQMQEGIKPPECEYCWKIEDLPGNQVSDRTFKSIIYNEDTLKALGDLDFNEDINPETLEIAFDSNCNFACSYCNPSFSTTWMADIKKNGIYENLISDGADAYQQTGTWAQPYGLKNTNNPYVAAFMDWWETDLQFSLTELRVTGGEALMSNDFWKLIDWWNNNPECKVRLAVNSNLGTNPKLIQRLCDATHNLKSFQLFTSNESFGNQSEYIRDGIIWDQWLVNLKKMIAEGNIESSIIMMTINALCLFSITDFMDEMLAIKRIHGQHHCRLSFNILRFPSFQSATTLPAEIRYERADHLEEWLAVNWYDQKPFDHGRGVIHVSEYEGIKRLISYLREVTEGHSHTSTLESRQRDFKGFFKQYDDRRGKSLPDTFPQLAEWYEAIPERKIIQIVKL